MTNNSSSKNIGLLPQANASENKIKNLNIRNCKIVSDKLNLKAGKLSDYWAQRAIGADLSKEVLLSTSPPKNNLVAVFDTPIIEKEVLKSKGKTPKSYHGIFVKNLISGSDQQAVLPELGTSLKLYSIPDTTVLFNTYKQHLYEIGKKNCPWEKDDPYNGLCPPWFEIDPKSNPSVPNYNDFKCCINNKKRMCIPIRCPPGTQNNGEGKCITNLKK